VKSKRSQQKTRRQKKRFKKKTFIFIISVIAIIGTFFYIMNHDYLAIEQVEVVGQKTLIEQDIHEIVENYLDGRILGLVRRDNLLLLSTSYIKKQLEVSFPKIEDLDVEKKDGELLLITIGERSAHSLWCIDQEYESIFDEECYFADRDGLLYARAPYFSGNVYTKLFIQPTDVETYIGTRVDVIDSFTDFFLFINDLEEKYNIQLGNILFDDFNDVSMDIVRLDTQTYGQNRPKIVYNQQTGYKTIIRDIGVVLDFASFEKDFTLRPTELESIDVRFENRALYVFTPLSTKE